MRLLRPQGLPTTGSAAGDAERRQGLDVGVEMLAIGMAQTSNLKGPTYALGSALLFGASTPFAKVLLGAIDPWLMAGLLYSGAGVGLLVHRLIANGGRLRIAIVRSDWPWLLGAMFFGGGVGPVLLMAGLPMTDAATSSLLLTLEGVFTAMLAWVVFREHVHARLIWGMAAIAVGAAMLAWSGMPTLTNGIGPLLVAGACLAWSIDNNLPRKVALNDATVIAMLKGLFAGAANLGLAGLMQPTRNRRRNPQMKMSALGELRPCSGTPTMTIFDGLRHSAEVVARAGFGPVRTLANVTTGRPTIVDCGKAPSTPSVADACIHCSCSQRADEFQRRDDLRGNARACRGAPRGDRIRPLRYGIRSRLGSA
jgi:uncharacterized membrane protein